jgi:hypothetical protein
MNYLQSMLLALVIVSASGHCASGVITLDAFAGIQSKEINESSALVASRQFENLFWTLNDSGDRARIFAIDSTGALIQPEWVEGYEGLELEDCVNIDWEDMAQDDSGNLVIAACGNNGNARRDVAVYVLPERDPRAVHRARALKRIDFHYPDQTAFPPRTERNFDCEAIFFAAGRLHFLSKHRSDDHTKLYRLDPPRDTKNEWYTAFETGRSYALTLLGEDSVEGLHPGEPAMVTAADADLDGSRMVLLSYHSIYLYHATEASRASGNWLAGTRHWLPIKARQCEAIALKGDWIWITNEQGDIFRLAVGEVGK